MHTLSQSLAQRDAIELRVIARNQGVELDDVGDSDLLTALTEQMLRPDQAAEVWADLPKDARVALAQLAHSQPGIPAPAFQRRYGELRRIGPGRLLTDQPWKSPTGPGETLWWLGWIGRGVHATPEGAIDLISIPDDLTPLLPLSEVALDTEPPLPVPIPQPAAPQALGQMLLDDLGTLLAFVQNHQVWLQKDGRWRIKDLQRLVPRLRLSSIRKQPLEVGGPLHLIFFAAKELGLLAMRNRQQRFGASLRPWLEKSRREQQRSLFQVWQAAQTWNDLCLMPEVRCLDGDWSNDPVLARNALLTQLARVEPGQWFSLDDFIAIMHEHAPDFQRPDGRYDTWYIQNAGGEFLRGFEHWPTVEGRLIRYIWQGPLFWLGVLSLGDHGEAWSLTPQGNDFLHDGGDEEDDASQPVLRIHKDFSIVLAPHIGLWDRLRVALFAFWQASEPEYRYLITRRGLRRAAKHGVSARRILDFLDKASQGETPANVHKALESFTP